MASYVVFYRAPGEVFGSFVFEPHGGVMDEETFLRIRLRAYERGHAITGIFELAKQPQHPITTSDNA